MENDEQIVDAEIADDEAPETYPFSAACFELVDDETKANVASMQQELSYLRGELDSARENARTSRDFYEARFSVVVGQLNLRGAEVIELEALIERIDDWRKQQSGATLADAASVELEQLLASIDNSPLLAHDSDVRRNALQELVQLVLTTTNDEALAGDIKRTWYERALQDVHERLSARLELES